MTNDKLITQKLDGLKEFFDMKFEQNTCDHKKIIDQTTKTNGTLSEQEKRIGKLEIWRSWIIGAMAMLGFIISLLLALDKFWKV